MGHLIKLRPELIKPSQDFLKKGTVDFILDCYKKNKIDSLPPTPLVRKHPNSKNTYVAIDGHNLLAVSELLGKACEVYIVSSADDYLPNPENKEPISQRNKDLTNKYESSVQEADRISCSFKELIKNFIV